MPRSSSRLALLALLVLCLGLSIAARASRGRQLEVGGRDGWVTTDADSLYHMRRVDRALDEGLVVAGTDPYLNYPDGAAIPWPPYFDGMAAYALAPFAPEDREEQRAFLEVGVGSLGLVFGALGTLVAALAGWWLARGTGALVAGSYHALCQVAVAYGVLGNGDHHTFVTFIGSAAVLVVSASLASPCPAAAGDGDAPKSALHGVRASLLRGALDGALIGVLLGSWVGGMTLLVALELVLGWLVVRQAYAYLPGLAAFGLALHGVAALVLAPAVVTSPWTELQPWMLVNLSWFHLAFLALGGLVFVPLLFLRQGSGHLLRYPWFVLAGLGLLTFTTLQTDLAVGAGIREGFAWASRTDAFMAGISESRSLFGAGAERGASFELGYAFWLLPIVLGAALWRALRRSELALLPWALVALVALWQTTQQARFAESLVLPMAVLLGWGAKALLQQEGGPLAGLLANLRRLPAVALAALALGLVALANAGSTASTLDQLANGRPPALERERPARLAARRLAHWIERNTVAGDWCVLADWSHGHTIEWAADRPTVATNFGSYVGEDSFRDPSRFFMEEDPRAAEALLETRKARYVLLTSELPNLLNGLIAGGAPERRARYVDDAREGAVKAPWFATMGARLMFDGGVFRNDAAPSLDFLRLVFVSPLPDPTRRLRGPNDVSPAAWLWERVAGASVEARGAPGETLLVELQLEFPRARRGARWRAAAVVDDNGLAIVRVPYSTVGGTSSEVRVRGAGWSLGQRRGDLRIDESAVLSGARVAVGQ